MCCSVLQWRCWWAERASERSAAREYAKIWKYQMKPAPKRVAEVSSKKQYYTTGLRNKIADRNYSRWNIECSQFFPNSFSPFSDPTSVLLTQLVSNHLNSAQFLTSFYFCHHFSTPLISSRLFLCRAHESRHITAQMGAHIWEQTYASTQRKANRRKHTYESARMRAHTRAHIDHIGEHAHESTRGAHIGEHN